MAMAEGRAPVAANRLGLPADVILVTEFAVALAV